MIKESGEKKKQTILKKIRNPWKTTETKIKQNKKQKQTKQTDSKKDRENRK